jgi:hypothetical protein
VSALRASPRSRYFAYGSNLLSRRLIARASSARALGAAFASGHRLSLGKPGRDGSGKATLVEEPGARVWGALYAIELRDWGGLDACEPGYSRVKLTVTMANGDRIAAETYIAPESAHAQVATPEYKRFIVDGAYEHGLPAEYIIALEALPEALAKRGTPGVQSIPASTLR